MAKMARWAVAGLMSAAASVVLATQPIAAQGPIQRDPNQKICQVATPVGSRLGGKKICATRAEWDAMKQQDKDIVNEVQRSARVGCSVAPSSTRVGTPSC